MCSRSLRSTSLERSVLRVCSRSLTSRPSVALGLGVGARLRAEAFGDRLRVVSRRRSLTGRRGSRPAFPLSGLRLLRTVVARGGAAHRGAEESVLLLARGASTSLEWSARCSVGRTDRASWCAPTSLEWSVARCAPASLERPVARSPSALGSVPAVDPSPSTLALACCASGAGGTSCSGRSLVKLALRCACEAAASSSSVDVGVPMLNRSAFPSLAADSAIVSASSG